LVVLRVATPEKSATHPPWLYPAVGYSAPGYMLCGRMGSSTALHSRRYQQFLARLRRAREDAGLTQVQVAKLVGRPQTWVSKCELGEPRVDVVELEDFAAAYGKPLE
jgi:Helix-turn-helix domain